MTSPKNSPAATNDPEDKEPMKIILAEDDKDDQELFMEALSAQKFLLKLLLSKTGSSC